MDDVKVRRVRVHVVQQRHQPTGVAVVLTSETTVAVADRITVLVTLARVVIRSLNRLDAPHDLAMVIDLATETTIRKVGQAAGSEGSP
jgi:hypothetical protein